MAVSKIGPLADNVPIVRADGTPTPEFVRQLEILLAEKAATDTLAAGAVPNSRIINTTSPLTGGGALTADLTIALDSATLNESIQDMLNTFLVAGSNVTLTYNDVANTLTIASSGGGGGSLDGCLVKNSATMTANYSSFQNISWDTEVYDTGSYHDLVTNPERLTITNAGYYQAGFLFSAVSGTLNSSNFMRGTINHYDSGGVLDTTGMPTNIITEISGQPTIAVSAVSAPVNCAAGDYFIAQFNNEADTSVGLNGWFFIRRVG